MTGHVLSKAGQPGAGRVRDAEEAGHAFAQAAANTAIPGDHGGFHGAHSATSGGLGHQLPERASGVSAENLAHTTFPAGPGSVQPHPLLSEATTCSPRPLSARKSGSLTTGTRSLGSATAQSKDGPGCSKPSRIGQRYWAAPPRGSA